MFKQDFLQLFAEAASGVTGADAGHQAQEAAQQERAQDGQVAAAETNGESLWERIKADPQANRELQAIIQARLKSERSAEQTLSRLAPVVEGLARRCGLDPKNPDLDALTRAVSPEPDREGAIRHLQNLHQQGEALKARVPGFDLRRQLQNPLFARLTSPDVGLSVEDAFFAVHRKTIQQATMAHTARQTAQKLSSAVAAGAMRPVENGTSGQAPSVAAFDYRAMSREQRNALKARIRAGEKIYP